MTAPDVTWSIVSDAAQLEAIAGTPTPRAATKVRPALHALDRDWLAASPICLIATAGADGRCDVSPRGDPPGFARILDDRTIAIPDRPGNRRADAFRNLLENPGVGLIFLVPGRGDTLRINGAAQILDDAPFFDELTVHGHRPKLALVVHIEEVFYHCSKALLRAALWDPETWAPEALASRAHIAKTVEVTDETPAELEEHYGPGYADGLYR